MAWLSSISVLAHSSRYMRDNICSASAQIAASGVRAALGSGVDAELLLAQHRQLLRVAQILVQRLQLRELALLRRAREHVVANHLELVP